MNRTVHTSKPRLHGFFRVVVAVHPAGRRLEIEEERFGATTTIAIKADEIDDVIAALVKARAEVTT